MSFTVHTESAPYWRGMALLARLRGFSALSRSYELAAEEIEGTN